MNRTVENILGRLGLAKVDKNTVYPQHLLATAGAERFNIPTGEMVKSQAELYQRLSWVNTAVSSISKLSATVKFNVQKAVGEDTIEIPNHPFELLLSRPNPLQSRFEFLEATYAYRCLTGNAFWWLNKSSPNSAPAEMWTISPHRITVVPDTKSYIKGYMYDPGDGSSIPLDVTEVVHFRSFHPTNPFMGLSPVEAIAIVAAGDLKAQEWNTRFFGDSNARLPGILAFADPIGDNEWEQLKQDAKNRSNKREIMMLRNVGAGGVQWLQAGASQKDMDYLNGRKFSKEEIFGIFAPGLASMMDVNATEANAKTGEATLMKLVIHPMLDSVAEKIANDILPLYGEGLTGEFDEVREKDRLLELSEEEAYSLVHTIAEIRKERYGDDPLGDERDSMLPAEVKTAPAAGFEDREKHTEIERDATWRRMAERGAQDIREMEQGLDEDKTELGVELKAYQRKAANMLTKGKALDFDFESTVIGKLQLSRIKAALKGCKSKDDIKAVFAREAVPAKPAGLEDLIGALVEATKALRDA